MSKPDNIFPLVEGTYGKLSINELEDKLQEVQKEKEIKRSGKTDFEVYRSSEYQSLMEQEKAIILAQEVVTFRTEYQNILNSSSKDFADSEFDYIFYNHDKLLKGEFYTIEDGVPKMSSHYKWEIKGQELTKFLELE